MKRMVLFAASVILALGCARLSVQGSKEPIKVDIAMRLDIYQHVEKDIDQIENMVSGPQEKTKKPDKQSLLSIFVADAYAQEGLSPEVTQAALNRKNRLSALSPWEQNGVVGENKSGLLVIRKPQSADSSLQQLISAENNDRVLIYRSVAQKNGTSVEEVEKLYAKRLQNDAPAGCPIEAYNSGTNSYEWRIK